MSLIDRTITAEQLDAVLPQTQCGLCGHGGCMPYAKAIVSQSADIHLCPPGGVETLKALGRLTNINPEPYLNEMQHKAKRPLLASIRESECIGCTKCIQACPVDAIIGAAKQMHSIITDQCTGCELCVPACPVDCIDLIPAAYQQIDKTRADKFRMQFHIKNNRIANESTKENSSTSTSTPALPAVKSYVELAIERAKQRKLSRA